MIETAKDYTSYGLSVIPIIKGKKNPPIKWERYETEIMNSKDIDYYFKGDCSIAIICGKISTPEEHTSLEVLDVDCSHDNTGTLWKEFSEKIKQASPELFNKLVIASTQSDKGGYHLYYKTTKNQSSIKLAQTKKSESLLETRGQGGYVVAPPSDTNRKIIQGTLSDIPLVTEPERDLLFTIARSFNQYVKPQPVKTSNYTPTERRGGTGLKSWEDYNQRGDIINLLEKHGFKQVGTEQGGDRVLFLRDGSDANKSGDFSYSKNTFKVFSTSTQFEAEKGYARSSVFSILECNGDFSISAKRLSEMGYGDNLYTGDATFTQTKTISVNKVNTINAVNSVIADAGDLIKIENIDVTTGDKVLITITEETPEEEINKAIEVIRQRTDKVFIKSNETEFIYYSYFLDKYINEFNNSDLPQDRCLSDLTSCVINLILTLPPIARDRVKFQYLKVVEFLGITEQGFNEEIKQKLKKADEQRKNNQLKDIILQSESLIYNGEPSKALSILKTKLPRIEGEEIEEEVDELKKIITLEEVKDLYKKSGGYLKTGFSLGSGTKMEPFDLPSGALTGIAGFTGHGKTDMLINLTLNCVMNYPDKEFYFFSYELSYQDCFVRFLNTYMDLNISTGFSNTKSIKKYYRHNDNSEIVGNQFSKFIEAQTEFENDIIKTGRLRIKGYKYTAERLCTHMEELSQEATTGGFFIDYFQKIRSADKQIRNRSTHEELAHVCNLLQEAVKKISIPVVLAVQFNREVANPLLIDERNVGQAGAIEQILDTLIALWFCNKTATTLQHEPKLLKRLEDLGFTDDNKLYALCLKSRDIASGKFAFWSYNAMNGKITN